MKFEPAFKQLTNCGDDARTTRNFQAAKRQDAIKRKDSPFNIRKHAEHKYDGEGKEEGEVEEKNKEEREDEGENKRKKGVSLVGLERHLCPYGISQPGIQLLDDGLVLLNAELDAYVLLFDSGGIGTQQKQQKLRHCSPTEL
ncbi:hypothetical protein niasHS_006181 [Heterodera schachtii]|uniref:Uncharacterized protein n=1 Tax=Heterodera schachtii TaxID=97005 RepID=A0ABD2JSF5_HETSC